MKSFFFVLWVACILCATLFPEWKTFSAGVLWVVGIFSAAIGWQVLMGTRGAKDRRFKTGYKDNNPGEKGDLGLGSRLLFLAVLTCALAYFLNVMVAELSELWNWIGANWGWILLGVIALLVLGYYADKSEKEKAQIEAEKRGVEEAELAEEAREQKRRRAEKARSEKEKQKAFWESEKSRLLEKFHDPAIVDLLDKYKNQETVVLLEKYGKAEVVDKIIKKEHWLGQTAEQLRDSIGEPEDVSIKQTLRSTKEVWKYFQGRRNQFALKITLVNGEVFAIDDKT